MATLKAMEVDNIDFLIERMGQDCSPNQYLRELTQNAIEAIQRTGRTDGHIVWDHFITEEGVRKLCIVDNGDGMTGIEMLRYINRLSSSSGEQGMTGNYGVGAKIAAAVHSPAGLFYISKPDHDDSGGRGTGAFAIQLMKAEGKYGLVPFGSDGDFEYFAELEDDDPVFPHHVRRYGSGTQVVILGKTDDADTAAGPIDQWVRKYLNTRYFTLPKNVRIQCRDARRTSDDLDIDLEEEKRENGLRSVHGQKWMLDGASLERGTVELESAKAHWWILPTDRHKFEPALKLPNAPKSISSMQTFHTSFNYKGHVALVHQNELYEVRTGVAGYHRLQQFGVIMGMSQVVIYVEPVSGGITTDTARTRLLINGQQAPWEDWATEFKSKMPKVLGEFIDSVDIDRRNRADDESIKAKIREMLPLFDLARYRPSSDGNSEMDDTSTVDDSLYDSKPAPPPKAEGQGRDVNKAPRPLLGKLRAGGKRASAVNAKDIPDVFFLYDEKARELFSNDDTAAHFVNDGLVQVNGNFRVFQFLVDYFAGQYGGQPGVRNKIAPIIEKWVKVVVCDVVLGLRAMGSEVWTQSKIRDTLGNDESFTMALVPRILLSHQLKREIYRELGKPDGAAAD